MGKKMETTIWGLGFGRNGKVATTILGYIGTAIRIYSFIRS